MADYLIIMVTALAVLVVGAVLVLGCFLLRGMRSKTRVEMDRDTDGIYFRVAGAWVGNREDTVKVGKKLYHMDYKYASMRQSLLRGNYAVLQFDMDDAKPMSFVSIPAGAIKKYNPELFQKVMTTRIYSNILSGITENSLFIILLVLVAGSVAVGIYGAYTGYQTQQQLQVMMGQLNRLMQGVPAK